MLGVIEMQVLVYSPNTDVMFDPTTLVLIGIGLGAQIFTYPFEQKARRRAPPGRPPPLARSPLTGGGTGTGAPERHRSVAALVELAVTLESNLAVEDRSRAPIGGADPADQHRRVQAAVRGLRRPVARGQLSGAREFDLIRFVMNSEVAVQGFFILSGYLVFGSYDRLGDTATFYRRRFLRIYPAYVAAVLLFLALGIGQALAFGRSVAWSEVPLYLAANLSTLNFLHPTVGGVFAGNTVEHLNGALWSIKVELMFYLLVPLLFWLATRLSFALVIALLIAGGALWWPVLSWLGEQFGVDRAALLQISGAGPAPLLRAGHRPVRARPKAPIGNATLLSLVAFALLLLLLAGAPREAMHALGLVAVIGAVTALPQA